MSDDKTLRGSQDRARINVHEAYELKYWSEKWSISEQQLRDAVSRVGPMVKDVERALGK